MQKILLFLLLLSAARAGLAQDIASGSFRRTRNSALSGSGWTLTFIPSALLAPDFTLLGGVQYRINETVYLVADLGYQFASSIAAGALSGYTPGKRTGYLIRPGIKFFPRTDRDGFYLQFQGFYKYGTERYDTAASGGTGAGPQHIRYLRRTGGLHFLAGREITINKRKTLGADLYLGLGVRHKNYGTKDGPADPPSPGRMILPDLYTSGTFISFPGGFRVFFRL